MIAVKLLTKTSISMKIEIEEKLHLELISDAHARQIFNIVDKNRLHLRQWLPFVDKMQNVEFAQDFVKGTMKRNEEGNEYAFVIVSDGNVVGRVGIYKIDMQSRSGEIGYWLAEEEQGKGFVLKACRALIDFCFYDLYLNRMEIRCGTENLKSKKIPEKLNFRFEGVMREAELLYGQFIDLNLFSLLKSEWR